MAQTVQGVMLELANERRFLIALRLEADWRTAAGPILVKVGPLVAQYVSVEYVWQVAQLKAQAMLTKPP